MRVTGIEMHRSDQDRVVTRNADQAEADDEHAGHRAGAERNRETLRQTVPRRFRRAHIGADRNVHADIAGRARERRADQKADRFLPAEERPADREDHGAGDGDGGVLAIQIGARAFLDGGRDFLHAGIARAHAEDGADGQRAIEKREHTGSQNKFKLQAHGFDPSYDISVQTWAALKAADPHGRPEWDLPLQGWRTYAKRARGRQ